MRSMGSRKAAEGHVAVTADHGVKAIWSQTENPSMPANIGHTVMQACRCARPVVSGCPFAVGINRKPLNVDAGPAFRPVRDVPTVGWSNATDRMGIFWGA